MNILDKINHVDYNNILLTFDSKNDISIKKVLSYLPNRIEFDIENFDVDIDIFKNISILREIKLNYLNNQITYIILDINKIPTNKDGELYKSRVLNSFIKNTFAKAYRYNNSDNPFRIKIILLSNLYTTFDNLGPKIQFVGGSQLLYSCDLVVQFLGSDIKVVKDHSLAGQNMNVSLEIRDIIIDNLING